MTPIQLFHPGPAPRVAVVYTEPAYGKPGFFMVREGRGSRASQLSAGQSYGPVAQGVLAAAVDELVARLKAEGYAERGVELILEDLESEQSRVRARAARRLARSGQAGALQALLKAAATASDDQCAILDALGELGDMGAAPYLREQSERRLLSRRRSAVEALRRLGDTEGLSRARELGLERLRPPIKAAIEGIDLDAEPSEEAVDALGAAVEGLEAKLRGLAWDSLYEIGTPLTEAATRSFAPRLPFDQAFSWRYLKSIYKRAMLRRDAETFGVFAHAIEGRARRLYGSAAEVKSGYDGAKRVTPIFQARTRDYVRRRSWRFLRELAEAEPGAYVSFAAAVLKRYTSADLRAPRGLLGASAECLLLHRILYGESDRFDYDDRRLRFRFRSHAASKRPKALELSFSELWRARPEAWIAVLAEAELAEVLDLAFEAFRPDAEACLGGAPLSDVLSLLGSKSSAVVAWAVAELERRFDPAEPDWAILDRLMAHPVQAARERAQAWLRATAPLWARDLYRVLSYLAIDREDQVETSLAAARAAAPVLKALSDPELRGRFVAALLAILDEDEPFDGAFDGCAALLSEAFADEASAAVELSRLLDWLEKGSSAVKVMAGSFLGARDDAVAALGTRRIAALGHHEVAAVRAAARALLTGAMDQLRKDPELLFILVESPWPDTHAFAAAVLRDEVDPRDLGFDGIIALCDSTREEVQGLGRGLLLRHLDDFDPGAVIARLIEHPGRAMRAFAVDMALTIDRLMAGSASLEQLVPLFRAVLLDVQPSRRLKDKVFDFVIERGLRSSEEAARASEVLSGLKATTIAADLERVLDGLVRLKLAYPELAAPISVSDAVTGAAIGGGA